MTSSCTCKKTQLQFATSQPRKVIECCCCDCCLHLESMHANGGPAVPKAPFLLTYFANDITGVKGLEHMGLFQLRDGAASTRVVATCCHSTLAVDHSAYGGNVLMVPGDGCKLTAAKMRASARIQEKWWKLGAVSAERYLSRCAT
eukprot:SAG22_NODE_6667_length_825_cov_1.144628_1_plen_144_part_01